MILVSDQACDVQILSFRLVGRKHLSLKGVESIQTLAQLHSIVESDLIYRGKVVIHIGYRSCYKGVSAYFQIR